MPMVKAQKVEYVKKLQKEIAGYKTAAIMPIDALPDRLLQRVRNQLKPDSKVIITRKSLLRRALGEDKLKYLDKHLDRNFALVLSNKDPTELYSKIKANKLQLGAKPNQISPNDITIEPGDTSIAPGQTVTELKSAGIDVQIQKGKVVIAKKKVLVEKGKKISAAVANALKILEIRPFEVAPKLNIALSSGLLYTEMALSIDQESIKAEIGKNFREAYVVSIELGMPNEYNVEVLITRAFKGAMSVGIEAKILEPEIVKILVANAAATAAELAKTAGIDTK